MIEIRIYDEEVILRLDQFPRKIREAMREKFSSAIFPQIREDITSRPPGKFLDLKNLETGVEDQGQSVIGFISYEDKPGTYPIIATKSALLHFFWNKIGRWIVTKEVAHPFLKGTKIVAEELTSKHNWIIDELTTAVTEVQF